MLTKKKGGNTMQKELFLGLVEQIKGTSGILSSEEKRNLEEEKRNLGEEKESIIERLKEVKNKIKEIDLLLKGESKAQMANLQLVAKLAQNIGVDLAALGIELPSPAAQRTGGKNLSGSKWFVDGALWTNERQEISYILWTITKNFGYGNTNGSMRKSEFEAIVESTCPGALEKGDDFEVTITSKDGKKSVTLRREIQRADADAEKKE